MSLIITLVLYSSVHVVILPPPAASPALCVPAPAKTLLAVINEPPADQDVPLYSSVQENDEK